MLLLSVTSQCYSFQLLQVEEKMNVNKLGKQDAEMDVFVDQILGEKKSDCNNNALDLLIILSKIKNDEEKVYQLKR